MRTPPCSEAELLTRAEKIAGLRLPELASLSNQTVPDNLHHDKGWIGQLLELQLGTDALCKPEPDFSGLGIELKTIPITPRGTPHESTFVCSIPLLEIRHFHWETSIVYRKLKRVLWIPIVGDKTTPLSERCIGAPLLWSPNQQQVLMLRQDWEELQEMITLGQLEQITAKHGNYLQIRPKAANAKSLRWGISDTGERIQTLPRGFYLRTCFTKQILKEYFVF